MAFLVSNSRRAEVRKEVVFDENLGRKIILHKTAKGGKNLRALDGASYVMI